MSMRLVKGHITYMYKVRRIINGPIGDFPEYLLLGMLFMFIVLSSWKISGKWIEWITNTRKFWDQSGYSTLFFAIEFFQNIHYCRSGLMMVPSDHSKYQKNLSLDSESNTTKAEVKQDFFYYFCLFIGLYPQQKYQKNPFAGFWEQCVRV